MRYTMKRALALLIAALLALPIQGVALGEEALDIVIDDGAIDALAIDGELDIGPFDLPVDEIDGLLPDDLVLGDLALPSVDSNESAPASPVPFDQTAIVDGVTFAVTAAAGAFPAESVLRVSAVSDGQTEKAALQAAEAAVEGPLAHHLYSIEVLDAAGNACMPGGAVTMPVATVRGLDVPGEAHVILYDPVIDGCSVIEAQKDEEGLKFHFAGSAIYDIMGSTGAPEQPEQPEEQPEQPVTEVEQSAVEQSPGEQSPGEQPVTEEGQSAEEQSAEEQPVTEVEQSSEEQSSEEQSAGEQSSEEQPVTEEEQSSDEQSSGEQPVTEVGQSAEEQSAEELPIIEEDLSADGQSVEVLPIIDEAQYTEEQFLGEQFLGEQPVADSLPFDQSQTVSGVTVTVRAVPGAFPAGAALSVKRVPSYKKRAAAAAIGEVRDGDANVAVSYTFDIKVIDSDTKEELQPAEGFGVEVSFALAEAGDGNLEATVYHLTGENGELTAEALDTGADGDAVTATTGGFSLYTVEFTYNNLEYVLPGGGSVALSEILSALGLTGEAEAVSVSDASLFSASNATGAWMVVSHRPFTTTEWMKVTIEGVTYEIAVTDDSFTVTANLNPAVDGKAVVITVNGNPAASAEPGATVTLTVPRTGSPEALQYGLCSLETNEETPVAVAFTTTDIEGVYTFTMPSAGVTATFTRWARLQEQLGKGGTVALGWDVTAVQDVDRSPLTVPAGVNATLDLNGHTVDRGLKNASGALENGNAVTVNAGGSLTVKDTSRAGNGIITGGNNSGSGGGVRVSNGTFTLAGGGICGNNTVADGGGVYVSNGAFNMEGGAISGNSGIGVSFGGGVYVTNGTFTMKDGIIGGEGGNANAASFGGGVYVSDHSRFTMEKGAVSGNTVSGSGSGVYVGGESAFIMKGGAISGNSAAAKTSLGRALGGGVSVTSGTFTMENGVISGNSVTSTDAMGGGVYVTGGGKFTLESGDIYGNKSSYHGAGVYVAGGSAFTMNGGAIGGEGALANVAQHLGGGVAIAGNAENPTTFKMTGGRITGNRATDTGGGGVFLTGDGTGDSATFIMEGGEISGNGTAGGGGGAYVEKGTFRLTGGAITGNEAHYLGGGVFLADRGALKMTGGKITGNALTSTYGDSTMRGAGVYVSMEHATMSAGSGSAINITGNTHTVTETEDNVYLDVDKDKDIQKAIQVTGPLADGTQIGVTTKVKPSLGDFVTFTEGLTSGGSTGVFSSDDAAFSVGWNAGKTEAALGPAIAHSAKGYTGDYDGAAHGVTVTVAKPTEGATVKYGKKKGAYDRTALTYTDAGDFTVYYQVTADGYMPAEGSAKVRISPIDATVTITGNTDTATYDGKPHTASGYTATASTALYDVAKDFTFSGTAQARRTDAGKTAMGLKASQFANANPNFKTVTFNVTDGYQQVAPIDATVTITGKADTAKYDGRAHTASGYAATASTALYDVAKDFTFSGTAQARRTDAGKTAMGLKASQFTNTNPNFKTVTFNVTDGYQQVAPIDATVTITGKADTATYDGKAHTASGYTATASTALYDVAKDFTFSGTAQARRTDAGKTAMGLKASQFANANPNFKTVTFNVTDGYQQVAPAPITITADDKAKTYGDDDPELTYKVTGLIGSDRLTGALTRKKGEKAGVYPIRQGTLSASANYTVAFTGGTFTIRERPVAPDITQQAIMTPVGGNALRLAWSKVDGARGYDVFFKVCDGKGNYPLVKTTGKLSCTIGKLRKGQAYKAYVKAWKRTKGRKVYIGQPSATVHCIAGGYNRKFCNARRVTVREKKLTLAKGKSRRIVATVTGVKKGREVLHHTRLLRYFSSDSNVAKVDRSGRVRGVGRGVCRITVMANNGVSATVKVTVK